MPTVVRLPIESKCARLLEEVEFELKGLLGERLKKLVLFGSYSRGDYDNESDIDVMALVDESEPEKKFEDQILNMMVDLSIRFDLVLSLFMEDVKEYEREKGFVPLLRDIEKEGIEIYAA
ncbi:MAG: nucleotidyltransferase domain-containing protein [Candidatus Omnitrophota bacterium]